MSRPPVSGPGQAYIAMRARGDPDAIPVADLGLRRDGTPRRACDPPSIARRSEAWRPWRAYAALLLWQSLTAPPPGEPLAIRDPSTAHNGAPAMTYDSATLPTPAGAAFTVLVREGMIVAAGFTADPDRLRARLGDDGAEIRPRHELRPFSSAPRASSTARTWTP